MEVYEYIEGYEIDEQYVDNMRFTIDFDSKTIEELVGQIIVKGERRSQYICFECPRYYDGVDLADVTKKIQVLYLTDHGSSDIVYAINAMKSDEIIRFGWLLPASACSNAGKLYFAVEFCGDNYMLKTLTYTAVVEESLDDNVVPEPTEQSWYITIRQQCEEALSDLNTQFESVSSTNSTLTAYFPSEYAQLISADEDAITLTVSGKNLFGVDESTEIACKVGDVIEVGAGTKTIEWNNENGYEFTIKPYNIKQAMYVLAQQKGGKTLAGLADYFVEVPYGAVGISGTVNEWTTLNVDPIG